MDKPIPEAVDRTAISLLVAAGFVTEDKANEALRIAHGFDKGPLAPPSAPVGVEGTWLWGKLMDWCREQRIAPATQDKLFAIAGEAHRLNALAQQPADVAVDEAMVERAWVAFCENNGSARQGIRAALTAALATKPGGAE